jgi:hypothetical protein
MKHFTRRICSVVALLGIITAVNAQTPSDAMMMEQRESCLALTYDQSKFDEYWEGTYLRGNATIAEVTRITVAPMIAIGLHDKLNFYISVPYVKTESSEPNGGLMHGVKGFQDLGLALKYQILKQQLGKGTLAVLGSVAYATPITNYLSDYRPYSIGNGTNEWSVRGIVQYQFDMGLYVRAAGGHIFRGDTKVERDYYYNNGSYYTPWMDVPGAWEYNGVVGLWLLDNSLKIEASYYAQQSTSGDDVRSYNAAQPTNKVHLGQIGGNVQYFIKPVKGLGVIAFYNQMVSGRNIGKTTGLGAGLTYQFKI